MRFPLHLLPVLLPLAGLAAAQGDPTPASPEDLRLLRDGESIYRQACQACHGPDGKGTPQRLVGFATPLPDFTDCSFASREPSADWAAVAHEGGPLRAFSPLMPAFGDALSLRQLEAAVEYIHAFCREPEWPRGEFNLPRALVTGKAYLEDEAVLTSSFDAEGGEAFMNELVLEYRFGARSEFEILLPFGWRENAAPGAGWDAGLGDVALELKHVLYDDLGKGAILSLGGELVLPTGDPDKGFGKDTAVFEPMLLYGQILPNDAFFQGQAGLELPFDRGKAENEAFWRGVLGRPFQEANWGRTWTPMLEVLGARELEGGADVEWDLVPQLQVSLSKRQHILLNLGVRVPLTDSGARSTEFMLYFLWDWFDGGLLEGW